jgi:transcriptional regulator with XRE-family HTH domain
VGVATRSGATQRRSSLSPLGLLLRHWRGVRRMSQLELALHAHVTPRHVSFVETGRANPSREMVLTLARALDVPLRERNRLLLAAGYAPSYRQSELDEPALAQVRAALERMLRQQEPYPAVVLDRYWNVTQTNGPAAAMFAWLLEGLRASDPPNIVRLIFGDLRPYVANWNEFGEALIQRVHREAVGGVPDVRTNELLDEVVGSAGVPSSWKAPDFIATRLPIIPVQFSRDGLSVSYFSTVTTLGTPQDITLQEIRVELFFPADDPTAAHRWSGGVS